MPGLSILQRSRVMGTRSVFWDRMSCYCDEGQTRAKVVNLTIKERRREGQINELATDAVTNARVTGECSHASRATNR